MELGALILINLINSKNHDDLLEPKTLYKQI
jgi:hypothetical protein